MYENDYNHLMNVNSDESSDESTHDYETTNIFYYIYIFLHSFSKYCVEHSIII